MTFVKGTVAPALTIASIFNGMRVNVGCFGIDDSQGKLQILKILNLVAQYLYYKNNNR